MRTLAVLATLLSLPAVLEAQVPSPPIQILESEGSAITLTAHLSMLDQSLLLVNQTDKQQTVTLTASDLRAERGSMARIAIEPASPLRLSPFAAQIVRLTGTLPEIGEFKGVLVVGLEGVPKPERFTLLVKREKGAQQIALDVSPDPPVYRQPCCGTTAEVRVQLTETTGAAANFAKPILQKLLVEKSDTYKPGAKYRRWLLLDGAGEEVTDGSIDDTLPRDGSEDFVIRIEGLRGTGKYEGAVRVGTANGAESKTFTLFIKDHWLLAGLVIFAGVWASYGLRHWLDIGRPTAQEELFVLSFRRRLHLRLPDAADVIRREIEEKLDDLLQRNALDPDTDVQAEVTGFSAQLASYLQVKAVLDLKGDLSLVADPARREEIGQRLERLARRLADEGLGALASPSGEALVKEAEEIRQTLLEAARQALDNAAKALDEEIAAERSTLEGGQLSAAEREGLSERLQAASAGLAQTKERLVQSGQKSGQPAVEAVRQAWNEYERSSRLYLAVSADRFRGELRAQTESPIGMEKTWSGLQQELLDMLPPEATPQQLANVRRRYLDTVLEALAKRAHEDASRVRTDNGEAAAQPFVTVERKAAEARTRLASGSFDAAELATLNKEYETARAALPDTGAEVLTEGVAETVPAEPLRPVADPTALATRPPDRLFAAQEEVILGTIRRNDKIIGWLISFVSVLLGLSLLWWTNETFGNLMDYIGAFLWGFGLHELNKIAQPAALAKLGFVLPAGKA